MNKLITMNKRTKIIVATIFAIILIAIGGFLFWNKNNNKLIQGKASDYRIADGKVSNSKAGFSYNIPQGWSAETIDYAEGSVIIYASGTKIEKNDIGAPKLPLENGCLIEVAAAYQYESLDKIKDDAKFYRGLTGAIVNNFETTTINGFSALKHTFEYKDEGKATAFYLFKKHKTYSFAVYPPNNEEESSKCLEDFGNFLETVSIK